MAEVKNKSLPIRIAGILETVNVTEKMAWDNSQEKYVEDNENGKYEIRLLIAKDDSMYGNKPIELVDKFNDLNDMNIPLGGEIVGRKELYHCIKDGDNEEHFIKHKDIYRGNWVITLKNQYQPSLFDIDGVNLTKLLKRADKKEIAEGIIEEQFYRGVTAIIIGNLYTNDKKEGIFGSLSAIRIVKLTEKIQPAEIEEFELTEEELLYFMDEDI